MGLEPQLIDIKPLKSTKHDDITTIMDDTISDLELHSDEAKHHIDNDDEEEQLAETLSSSSASSSSNSSPSSSCIDLKKLDYGKDDTTQWSMMSATPRAGSSANSSMELLPPNHPDWNKMFSNISSAPRMQTMNRVPAGYDPTRIPSHVFSSSKASTPMEWSAASNDSLFSIHMGITSFPRDHIFKVGVGVGGDTKPEECTNTIPRSNNVPSNLPPVSETSSENDKKFTQDDEEDEEEDSKVLKESTTQTLQEIQKENQDSGIHQEVVSLSSNSSPTNSLEGKGSPALAPRASHDSATSTTSASSFAFPLLVEVGKSASLKAIEEEKHDEVQQQPDQQPQNETSDTPTAAAAAAPATGTSLLSFLPNWLQCC